MKVENRGTSPILGVKRIGERPLFGEKKAVSKIPIFLLDSDEWDDILWM